MRAHTHHLSKASCGLLKPEEKTSLFYPQSSHYQNQPTALQISTSGHRSEECLNPLRPEEVANTAATKPNLNPIYKWWSQTTLPYKIRVASCYLVQTLCGQNQPRSFQHSRTYLFPLCSWPQIHDFSFFQLRFYFLVTSSKTI